LIRGDPGAIDLRSLAAFRIGLAATLLLDLAYRSADLEAHYGDAGVLPRSALAHFLARPGWLWSLHAISGDTAVQALRLAVAPGAAVALGVGYRTRATALASWLLLASLQHRNPLILIAGDRLLLLLLLWGLFLPMGARWSVDAKAGRAAPGATHCTGLPAWALLVQTALVYASTALYKWAEPVWRNLDAVALTLSVDGVATPVGRWLQGFDGLPAALTALVLGVETLAPVLAFSPWRRAQVRITLVLALVTLHLLGLGATLRLGLIPLVMSVAWLPFLPEEFWDWLRKAPRSRGPAMRAIRASRVETALALGCLTLVLVDTAIAFDRPRFERGAPRWSAWLIASLDLRQEWRMWQRPLRNRYYVFAAELEDGREIDLHTKRALDWDAPRPRSTNNHWWKYQDYLSRPVGRPFRAFYMRYLAREWNRSHPTGPPIARLTFAYVDGSQRSAAKSRLPRRILWEGAPPP